MPDARADSGSSSPPGREPATQHSRRRPAGPMSMQHPHGGPAVAPRATVGPPPAPAMPTEIAGKRPADRGGNGCQRRGGRRARARRGGATARRSLQIVCGYPSLRGDLLQTRHKPMTIPGDVIAALAAIHGGATAASFESDRLDFKEDARTEKESHRIALEAALCFANAAGGSVVFGVKDEGAGPSAFVGSGADNRRGAQVRVRQQPTPSPGPRAGNSPNAELGWSFLWPGPTTTIHSDSRGRRPAPGSAEPTASGWTRRPSNGHERTDRATTRPARSPKTVAWTLRPSPEPEGGSRPRCGPNVLPSASCQTTTSSAP